MWQVFLDCKHYITHWNLVLISSLKLCPCRANRSPWQQRATLKQLYHHLQGDFHTRKNVPDCTNKSFAFIFTGKLLCRCLGFFFSLHHLCELPDFFGVFHRFIHSKSTHNEFLFFHLGFKASSEIQWVRPPTQWTDGDRFGAHILSTGKHSWHFTVNSHADAPVTWQTRLCCSLLKQFNPLRSVESLTFPRVFTNVFTTCQIDWIRLTLLFLVSLYKSLSCYFVIGGVIASVLGGQEALPCLSAAVFQVQPHSVQKWVITGVTGAETFYDTMLQIWSNWPCMHTVCLWMGKLDILHKLWANVGQVDEWEEIWIRWMETLYFLPNRTFSF